MDAAGKLVSSGGREVVCPRHMVVQCSPQFKSRLFELRKKLAGVIDPRGYKYFIANYVPEPFKATREKHKEAMDEVSVANSKKKSEERFTTKIVGTDLVIDEEIQIPQIKPLSPFHVLEIKQKYSTQLNVLNFSVTCPLPMMGSTFQGYAIKLSHVNSVNLCLAQIRIMEPHVCHIMFAYDIQGQKGSCDDGEFFGDLQIAKHLKKTKTKDVAVFVTRLCGPHQLGAKRFQIICTLVDELLQIIQRAEDLSPVDEAWVDVVAPCHVDEYNAAE